MLKSSVFKTKEKQYTLFATPLTCHKFGLSEFLAKNIETLGKLDHKKVLDVGCGVGPISILFADQLDCYVTGVELNPIACECCRLNIAKYNLFDKIELIERSFENFETSDKYDVIISNPPIDDSDYLPGEKTTRRDYRNMTPELFMFLTNSWRNDRGENLVDLMFSFSKLHLSDDGQLVIVYCSMSDSNMSKILKQANMAGLLLTKTLEGCIEPESIGVEDLQKNTILATMLFFKKTNAL